ncbi:Rpn family recombination-promoting nuclease/putative transposase [Phormidium nigroviride]
MAEADIGSKRLISLAPNAWVQWVTNIPDAIARNILDAEFQWLSRESDVLVKAYSPEHGEFLVLNELQSQYTSRMPRRMRAYAALAQEKYNLPVYPVLVNIFQPEEIVTIPTRYESNFMGLIARQDYRVINLWEVDVELAFGPSLTPLLPFVPILKGGDNESVVVRAVTALRADEQLQELENLLGFFACSVFDVARVREILRFDMAILQKSPLFQQMAREQRQEGREEGRLEGREEGALRLLSRLIQRRFGEIPVTIQANLQRLNIEQLDELLDVLFTVNSLDEFINSIPSQNGNGSELG